MTEGSAESLIFVLRVLVLLARLIGAGISGILGLGVSGWRWISSKCRRSPRLVDFDIQQLPETFRSGIRWSITINGQTYRIASIDDLPEAYRGTMRARLKIQAEGIHQILGVPALPPVPDTKTEMPQMWEGPRPQDISDELSAMNPVREWEANRRRHLDWLPIPSDSWGDQDSGSSHGSPSSS